MKFKFVTFYTENTPYETFGLTLKQSILNCLKLNDNIKFKTYTDEDLCIKEYMKLGSLDPLKTKGYGYMAWKPFIIQKELQQTDCDFLIYLDADMLLYKQECLQEFLNEIEQINKSCFFRVGEYSIKNYKDVNWCRSDLIDYFEKKYRYTGEKPQIMSGIMVMKVDCNETKKVINEWLNLTPRFVSNFSSETHRNDTHRNDTHRNDQSILSCLVNSFEGHTSFGIFNTPTQFGIEDNQNRPLYKLGNLSNPVYFKNRGVQGTKINVIPKVGIIVPTTCSNLGQLKRCLKSIQKQTYINTECFLVFDGVVKNKIKVVKDFVEKECFHRRVHFLELPMNVGSNGWYGYNAYASVPYLFKKAHYISFLDEDNFIHPQHIQSYIELLDKKPDLDWAYCLRKIVPPCNNNFMLNKQTKGQDFVSSQIQEYDFDFLPFEGKNYLEDNCESLGDLSSTVIDKNDYLVDTSCYFMKRIVAINISRIWTLCVMKGVQADRGVFKTLKTNYPSFDTAKQYTLYYQTRSGVNGVSYEFFQKGNEKVNRHGEYFRRIVKETQNNGEYFRSFEKIVDKKNEKVQIKQNQKEYIYLYHFNFKATDELFLYRQSKANKETITNEKLKNIVYQEWQLTLADELAKKYKLVNAFTCYDKIPKGSKILIHCCNINDLPLKYILDPENEFYKMIYTIEGPNIRHQKEWHYFPFLRSFDKVFTYWEELLKKPNAEYKPFPHRLNFDTPAQSLDILLKGTNDCKKTVCFVGENRPRLSGTYVIDNVKLKCLDPLRSDYVSQFMKSDKIKIEVYGKGWEPYKSVIRTNPKDKDTEFNYQIFSRYTFTLIIENCDADGYVSEKIYDAFVAGSIPIYYGNLNDRYSFIPKNCYIDAKSFYSPKNLVKYIENLSFKQIKFMKESILKHRIDILKKVSVNNYTF